MTSCSESLPSVSSLLKWARGEGEHVAADSPAAGKRSLSAFLDDAAIPAPLTAAIVQRATDELPQGACVALESCLGALKVHDRHPQIRAKLAFAHPV